VFHSLKVKNRQLLEAGVGKCQMCALLFRRKKRERNGYVDEKKKSLAQRDLRTDRPKLVLNKPHCEKSDLVNLFINYLKHFCLNREKL
jgi:hypothetical protein